MLSRNPGGNTALVSAATQHWGVRQHGIRAGGSTALGQAATQHWGVRQHSAGAGGTTQH